MASNETFANQTTVTSPNRTLQELNDEVAVTLIPAMVFVGVLMIVGVVGNGIVCYIFGKEMQKGTQNFLILSLAVFDILSCTVAMPTEIVDMRDFYMFESEPTCKILRFVNAFTAIASIFTLLVIALDRYRNVLRPLQRQMSLRTAYRSLIIIVICSLVFSWPALVLSGIHYVDVGIPGVYGRDCSTSDAVKDTVFPLIYNIVQFAGFIFITLVLIVIYVRILRETKRHYKYLKDNTDFYFVSGSVARPETSRHITLISDSRINLHDYFIKEGDKFLCLEHQYDGIDNAGFDSRDGEDSKSISSREQRYRPKSPKHNIDSQTPLPLRRFKGGRTNGKYFISRYSDEEIILDRILKLEGKSNAKSASSPNFADLLMRTTKKDIRPKDIKSEGKPTPVAKRKYMKRQMSSVSSGKRSMYPWPNLAEVKAATGHLYYSDGDVRKEMGSKSLSLCVNKGSDISINGDVQRSAKSLNTSSISEDINKGSHLSTSLDSNPFANNVFQFDTSPQSVRSLHSSNSQPDFKDSPSLSKNLPSRSSSTCEHKNKTFTMTPSNHHLSSSATSPSLLTQSEGSEKKSRDYQDSNGEVESPDKLAEGSDVDESDSTTGASAVFFVPTQDEGIDMSYEMDEDIPGTSGIVALCPRCQANYYIEENRANNDEKPESQSTPSNTQSSDSSPEGSRDQLESSTQRSVGGVENIGYEEEQFVHEFPDQSVKNGADGDERRSDQHKVYSGGRLRHDSNDTNLSADTDSLSQIAREGNARTLRQIAATCERSNLGDNSYCDSDTRSNSNSYVVITGQSNLAFSSCDDSPSLSNSREKTNRFNSPPKSDRKVSQEVSSDGISFNQIQASPKLFQRVSNSVDSNDSDWASPISDASIKIDPASLPSSATRIAICVTTVFILSFLPHLSLMLARVLKPDFDYELTGVYSVLYNIFLRSYLVNSALNPFVYGWLNQHFRHRCCQILKTKCPNCNSSKADSSTA